MIETKHIIQARNYYTTNMKDKEKTRKEYKYSTSGVFKKKDPYDPPYDPGSEP